MVLAACALAIQVLVPEGYMVSADRTLPGLVICTTHGPLVLDDHGKPAKAPKPASSGLCSFAVHAGGSGGPPALARIAAPLFAPAYVRIEPAAAPTPGLGLAAPPPPSQAPPTV